MPEWLKSLVFGSAGTLIVMVVSFAVEQHDMKKILEEVKSPAGFNQIVTDYLNSDDYRKLAERKISSLLSGEDPKEYIQSLIADKQPYEMISDFVNLEARIARMEKMFNNGGTVNSILKRVEKVEGDTVLIKEHVAIDDAAECCMTEDNILKRWCITGLIGWVNHDTLTKGGVDSTTADRPCIVLNLKRPPDNIRQTIQDSLRANPYVYVSVKNRESALKEKAHVAVVWGQEDRPRFIALANRALYRALGIHAGSDGGFSGIIYIYTKPEIAEMLSEYHPLDGWRFFRRESN